MSLLIARASLAKRYARSSGSKASGLGRETRSTTNSVSRPLSSNYTSKRTLFASVNLKSKSDSSDFLNAFVSGNKDAVRQAYKQKQKTATQEFQPKQAASKSETRDAMEDILDAALPGRKKSDDPDFGDVEAYKKRTDDMKLSELLAAEAEEDRGWRTKGKSEEGDGDWNGFGVDAPVKVPAEVFELNAQAQFSFLKEEFHEAQDYLEQSLSLIRSRLGERHNEAATVMVSLSHVHEKLKQFDRAATYLHDAINIRQLIDGPGHTSVAVALNKLAHIQTCQKQFEAAIESSKMALRIIQAAQATNEHEIQYYVNHKTDIPEELETQRTALQTEAGQILNTRGAIHFKSGDRVAALKDWEESVSAWSKLLPVADSIANPLFAVHRNMVHLYKQDKEQEKALAVARAFISLLERHQPKSPLLPTAFLFSSQLCEHFALWDLAWQQAEFAHKASLEINGHCEETDDLQEVAALLGLRIQRIKEAAKK